MQSIQINSLQNEIADIKKGNPFSSEKGMTDYAFKLEMQLSKLLEKYLKRYETEHNKKLNAFMAGRYLNIFFTLNSNNYLFLK